MNIPDLIDYCWKHAPPGFVQDEDDREYAKEKFARNPECDSQVLFTWNTGCAVGIHPKSRAVMLQFLLARFTGPVAPYIEFVERVREYFRQHTE